MKIRTDFVTNSSSSSFTVEITLEHVDGCVSFFASPNNDESGGTVYFNADLRDINRHLSSVEELARWLMRSVGSDWDDELVNYSGQKRFINDAVEEISSVSSITNISVVRNYYAWGEFADLIAENDKELKELALKYKNSESEIGKKRAKAELITYLQTADDARGEHFASIYGNGMVCDSAMYNLKSNIDEIVRCITENYCINNVYSGYEFQELDLTTGEYRSGSEYDI